MAAVFALSVLAGSPVSGAGKIYKWVDAEGKVHFSDTPAEGAQEVKVRVPSHQGTVEVTPTGSASSTVKIYVTATCGYCKKAKAHLARRGIPFTEYDVETDAQGRAEYQRLRGRGVPIILVGEKRMDGYSEAGLEGLLRQAGF